MAMTVSAMVPRVSSVRVARRGGAAAGEESSLVSVLVVVAVGRAKAAPARARLLMMRFCSCIFVTSSPRDAVIGFPHDRPLEVLQDCEVENPGFPRFDFPLSSSLASNFRDRINGPSTRLTSFSLFESKSGEGSIPLGDSVDTNTQGKQQKLLGGTSDRLKSDGYAVQLVQELFHANKIVATNLARFVFLPQKRENRNERL